MADEDLFDLSVGPAGEPDVDPELVAGAPDPLAEGPAELGAPTEVSEDQVRGVLRMLGVGAGQFFGDDDVPEHWHFTEDELGALTPPLTRYVNRSARLRKAVEQSDTATIAVVLGGWGWRNVADGARARRDRQEATEEVAPFHGQPREADPHQDPHARAEPVPTGLFGGGAPDAPAGGPDAHGPAGLDGR